MTGAPPPRVDQRQEYELEDGPLAALLDVLMLRRKWDAGIRSFFTGLKSYVEKEYSRASPT